MGFRFFWRNGKNMLTGPEATETKQPAPKRHRKVDPLARLMVGEDEDSVAARMFFSTL